MTPGQRGRYQPLAGTSRPHQYLERLARVHGSVALGYAVGADGAVEDPAGFDASLKDVGEELVDAGAGRGGACGEGDVVAEEAAEADRGLLVLGDAQTAGRPTWSWPSGSG
ncbi:hypothetical protein GCM10010345_61000 [Streptomyces canarius]|uniref:Uncharacterized protein n=1 Tax=Streptomyces canarius TaxID=285453 RepID=A0ABQ3CX80_9ACTN|nr:hypothetical protein GCM10010345_61000 [Streptomyces canarius]